MILRIHLAAVMFLCFFIPGAYMVLLGLVLTKHGMGDQIGNAFSCGPIAAIITPFLIGYLVDRYFSAERVLGCLHILGSALLFCMPHFVETKNSTAFLVVFFVYSLCFYPTHSLMNNIAFHHVGDVKRMPYLRLFANGGWLVPGFVLGIAGLSSSTAIFYLAAVASLILSALSLSLPANAPDRSVHRESKRETLAHVLSLLRDRNFLVLLGGLFLISLPMALYYAYTSAFADTVGFADVGSTLSTGQLSELVAIALIPVLIDRFGYKWIMVVGMAAWALRYSLFALGAGLASKPLVFVGIAIHGVCYDFLFVTAFIYTEQLADSRAKAQAQGLIIFCAYGVGQLIGSQIGSFMYGQFASTSASALTLPLWQQFWIYPALIAAGAALVILFGFRNAAREAAGSPQLAMP